MSLRLRIALGGLIACFTTQTALSARPGPMTNFHGAGQKRHARKFLCLTRDRELMLFRRCQPAKDFVKGETARINRLGYELCGHPEARQKALGGLKEAANFVDMPAYVHVEGRHGVRRSYFLHGDEGLPEVVFIDVKRRFVQLRSGFRAKLLGFSYNPKWMAVETNLRERLLRDDGFKSGKLIPVKSPRTLERIDMDLMHFDYVFLRPFAGEVPPTANSLVVRNRQTPWTFDIVPR